MARIDHESGSSLRKALRAQYPLPHYALLYEVASGMGKTLSGYADAIAMSLFPSRGLDIEGFEIKTDRGDWLRELKNPDKAEWVAKFCDRWWLVIGDEGIAKPDEVPAGWGLYVLDKNDNLKVVKKPRKLKAAHPDRTFIGAMLRRANEMAERERERAVEAIDKDEFVRKARAQAEKEAQRRFDEDLKVSTREHEALKGEIEEFEQKSGIKINMWNGARMGEAVNLLMNLKDSRDIDGIERLAVDVSEKAGRLREAAEQLKQAGLSFSSLGKLPT
jgi:hypothetical protein